MNKLDIIERSLIGLRAELTLISSEGFAMHDTDNNVVQFQDRAGLHRIFAPGVIEGPFTRDSQERHEWEDAEALARFEPKRDYIGIAMRWAQFTAGVMFLVASAGWAQDAGYVNWTAVLAVLGVAL